MKNESIQLERTEVGRVNPCAPPLNDKGDQMLQRPKGDSTPALLVEPRVNFAAFRTSLALDRTTLAWIRTALTIATFGFGMIGFFRAMVQVTHNEQAVRLHAAAIHMGVALVVIGAVGVLLAACSHWVSLRKLRRGQQLAITQWPLTITIAVLIAVLGLYGLWSLSTP